MRKIIIIYILVFFAFILSGCSVKPKEMKVKDIFNQGPDTYYVYFYKSDCPACENLKPHINQYYKFTKSNEGKNSPKIYQINVYSLPNLNAPDDWQDKIIGTRNILELTIGSTPTLIHVEDNRVSRVTVGLASISAILKQHQE